MAVAQASQVLVGCDWVNTYSDWDTSLMRAICMAESRGRYDAVNPVNYDGISDYGLLQLHGQAIFEPRANVAAGHSIWLRQGYQAWSVYNNSKYRQFLGG